MLEWPPNEKQVLGKLHLYLYQSTDDYWHMQKKLKFLKHVGVYI